MRYKVKLHAFADNEATRRKVKHVEAAGFAVDAGVLMFYTDAIPALAIAAGDWYQVSVVT